MQWQGLNEGCPIRGQKRSSLSEFEGILGSQKQKQSAFARFQRQARAAFAECFLEKTWNLEIVRLSQRDISLIKVTSLPIPTYWDVVVTHVTRLNI